MKESGVKWLGVVPAHWEVARLKHVATVRGGVAKGRNLGDSPTVTLPYLRVANVQDGYIDLTEVAEIEVAVSEVERYSLRKGDVLMNEGGDNDKLGRGDVWNGEIHPCLHQNHVFAVRPSRIVSEWLALLTSSDYAKRFFESRAKQTTNLASISSSNLSELPVLLPPEREQRELLTKVAGRLGPLESAVSRAKAMVELAKEHRSALIAAAVTGKIDVREVAS
jgi:type I restriction enzyme S subunit